LNRPPDVSLVFETANDLPDGRIRFADVVEAWKRQTRADRVLEWVVVATRDPTPAESDLLSGVPIRWLVRPELVYFQQKNAGIAEARGAFITFADSDALPAQDWLERALGVLENADAGVALVAGRSRYLPGLFSREMELAQLGEHTDHPHDTASFLAHNVLLRADAIRASGLFAETRSASPTRIWPASPGSRLSLRYDPSLRATHNCPGGGTTSIAAVSGWAIPGRFHQHVGGPIEWLWDLPGGCGSRSRDGGGPARLLDSRSGSPSPFFSSSCTQWRSPGYELAVRGSRGRP
jgi:hypothetical protein